MPADPFNLVCSQGEDYVVTVVNAVNGSISSWTLAWYLRNSSGGIILTLGIGTGLTVTDTGSTTTPGKFTATFTAAQTTAQSIGLYQWDAWRTNSGSSAKLAYGSHVILGVGSEPFTLLGSYASPADLLARHSIADIGDWASDSGASLTRAQVLAPDPNVIAALLDASGDVEMACSAGQRYSPADLAGLTGATQGSLKRLVCVLAAYYLAARRIPDPQLKGYETALKQLEALRAGALIFGLLPTALAGQVASVDLLTDSKNRETRPTEMARRKFGRRMDNRRGGNPSGSDGSW
jgi:phage gp36-like protein